MHSLFSTLLMCAAFCVAWFFKAKIIAGGIGFWIVITGCICLAYMSGSRAQAQALEADREKGIGFFKRAWKWINSKRSEFDTGREQAIQTHS